MKIFLKRLALFLLPVMAVLAVLEFSLQRIPNDYSFKNRYLNNNAHQLEMLILGNSHAYRGIYPNDLDVKGFNAAQVSQSLNLDIALFHKYKNQLKELDYLVLTISYHSLFSSLETSVESWRIKNYNLYFDLNASYRLNDYSELLSNSFDINYEKFDRYYIKKKKGISCDRTGSGSISMVKIDSALAVAAARRHTKPNLPYYKEYVNDLDGVLRYCNQVGVKVILTTLPAHKFYLNSLDVHQLKLTNRLLDSLVKEHENAYRFDQLKSEEYLDDEFMNADHLNLKGARRYSSSLNNFLKEISE